MESRDPLRELGGALRAVLARLRGGGRGRAGAGPGPADSPLAEVSLCRYRGRTGRGPRAVRAAALLGRARYGPGTGAGAGRGGPGGGGGGCPPCRCLAGLWLASEIPGGSAATRPPLRGGGVGRAAARIEQLSRLDFLKPSVSVNASQHILVKVSRTRTQNVFVDISTD